MKKLLSLVLALAMIMSVAVVAGAAPITDFNDYQTQANEIETFCIQHSQGAVDLNVLSNCIDGLLTNDNHGSLKPAVATEWTSPDGGQTWVFTLREDASWVDYEGNYMADCVADDFLWGMEFILNAAKNEAANTSMPIEMIAGAGDYYELTKAMEPEEAKKLGLDLFKETVAMSTDGDYSLTIGCVEPLAYFPTLAAYCALSPVSGDLLADLGAEGYLKVTYDKLWYNGPYTITEYVQGNQKVFTANPEWYGYADGHTTFNTVTVKMVESTDVAFGLYQSGELDYIELNQSNLDIIAKDENNPYHNYLVEARPTKYAYSMKFCWDKLDADGNPDINWNTAIANAAFRKAFYYGIDWTTYLGRINSINPLSCINYAYTANAVSTTTDGTDYTTLVKSALGLDDKSGSYDRYNPELFAQYKAQAIEELTALGVTFPVVCDYYISGSSQTAKDTADVMAQLFSDYLGDDFMVLNIKTYVSSLSSEVRTPQLGSIYISGWGADFGDPVNFMGQETYADDNAYFSQSYNKINKVVDGVTTMGASDLIETYKTFTELVNKAKSITDDQDARLAAFVEAEKYHIENVIALPMYYNVSWRLNKVNNYSQIYSAYGMQSTRYVDWETDDAGYTTEQYEAFKAAYNAE